MISPRATRRAVRWAAVSGPPRARTSRPGSGPGSSPPTSWIWTICAWSRGSIDQIMWSVDELLAYASASEPLEPGELIASGTVPGGCGLELGRRLQPGDVIELEVSGVGVLRNRLGPPEPLRWSPSPRTPAP